MRKVINSLTKILFLAILITGCEEEQQATHNITGKLAGHSDCKSKKSANYIAATPDSLSCIEYSFVKKDSIIYLNHINAGFNCCPGELSCFVYFSGDTIIIHELEEAPQCHCDCLFDLEIEIYGAVAKKYTLKFFEPYSGEQKKLVFDINLRESNTGSYCVTRKGYPWGLSNLTYKKS